jgi:hypothetical protein
VIQKHQSYYYLKRINKNIYIVNRKNGMEENKNFFENLCSFGVTTTTTAATTAAAATIAKLF